MWKTQETKYVVLICVMSILVLCLAWKGLKLYEFQVDESYINEQDILSLDNVYNYDININYFNGNIFADGWFIKKGESTTRKSKLHMIMRNYESGRCYMLPTEVTKRADVTEFFGEEDKKYDWSGFIVRKDKIDVPNGIYELIIMFQYNDSYGMVNLNRTIEIY